MHKESSQNPNGVDAEQELHGGFMFVAITGSKGQAQDKGTRKRLRAHVMHNFRDKKAELSQRGVSGEDDRVGQQARKAPANAGQKLRFRLKDDGQLEENIPLRQRKKKMDKQISAENDVKESGDSDRQKQPAAPSPDFETWARQYFGEQANIPPDLQPNFQLPFLLHMSEKQQYKTVTKGLFDESAPKHLWEEVDTLPKSTAPAQIPLPTSPLVPFDKGRLDPLNVLPFQVSRRDEEFIENFRAWETDSWCPVNGSGVWFGFALKDELLFHATIYHWGESSPLDLAEGVRIFACVLLYVPMAVDQTTGMHFMRTNVNFLLKNPETTDHKLASFRIINQQLSIINGTVRDETMAAVAAIVDVEMSFGSRDEAKKHMSGLETMVNMRGGIENIKESINGVLQRLIGWNDLKFAELFGVQLTFTKDCTHLQENESNQSEGSCFRQSIHGVDYGPLVWDRLQGDVINLLHEVRVL